MFSAADEWHIGRGTRRRRNRLARSGSRNLNEFHIASSLIEFPVICGGALRDCFSAESAEAVVILGKI